MNDSERLDWIWKQAQTKNGGIFQIKGIELFTVSTQHIKNCYGIRELIDEAIKKASEK